jgi:hypothetical protein
VVRAPDSRAVVLAAVAEDGSALRYASERLKADREVALAAAAQDGYALRYAVAGLKADRGLVLEVVALNGLAWGATHRDRRGGGGGVFLFMVLQLGCLACTDHFGGHPPSSGRRG